MGFLDMGILEILLILVVALIIWGPGKLPEIAKTLGRITRTMRRATFDLTTAVTKELDAEEKDRLSQSSNSSSNEPKQPLDVTPTEPEDEETTGPSDQ